ncbi:efflux RND transporter periplasmic adaptor subunit [Aristophania vespae]|uniref:Efflux RND transporter periplasmic adaptor subunit n=1 Tax=Aristophania vespae TaxID=2697033 RepID=A0A6P1NKN1_9PROT|nr:efflux RND transporter periplasmic adaptor subunit [Aristophania vespae]QHI96202.1 efflux RND transporter periplasmic adaptor subunit [Aristophania vespae]UMM63996.1 Cobalt-zinc-cadmium resistance protein CzcB [Aristophania vespae]
MVGSRSLAKAFGLFILVILCLWGLWRVIQRPTLPAPSAPMITRVGTALHVRADSSLSKRLIVEPVIVATLPHLIEVPAELTPAPGHDVNIYSPVTGRIINIAVQPGQTVQKGEILARVLSGDLAQARSDQKKAQAALNFARLTYNRTKAVMAAGGNAVKDMQSAHNDLIQAEAEANRAQQHLEAIGEGRNDDAAHHGLLITSPVNGVISSVNIGKGQQITDISNALMSVVDLSDVWVSAHVPENLIPQLRPNMTLTANFDGQTCSGPVTSQSPVLHNDTRRIDLYLRCANPDNNLRPGQFTTASISVPERQQILLPKTALVMNNDAVTVMVETAPHVYRRRQIEISYDEGPNVRVISGLKAGEHVITHGAILLNDN